MTGTPPPVAAIVAACAAREGLLRDLLARSVAVPSLSGDESGQAEVLAEFFRTHGAPHARSPHGSVVALLVPAGEEAGVLDAARWSYERWLPRARVAVTAARTQTASAGEGGGLLAFNAHMDVVEAGDVSAWRHPPFAATAVGDRIYGRGTCDMKGALAAMAVALVAGRDLLAAGHGLQMPVVACFVPDEERAEGFAFSHLLGDEGFAPTCVLLGEPSSGAVARGQRGKLELHLRARGRRAHTSVPEAGDNAATKMARAAQVIDRFERAERARCGTRPDAMLERTTLVLTAMRTVPFHRSFVPDAAEAYVTGRLARGVTRDSLLAALARDPEWPADLEIETTVALRSTVGGGEGEAWRTDHPAWELAVDHPFAHHVAATHAALFGVTPEFIVWPFSTDGVASAGRRGIPTLGYGPGTSETAHIVDEYVTIDALRRAFTLYCALPFVGR